MHSAANYLQRAGWRAGEPVALEVRLPQGFDVRYARISHRMPMEAWTALGVLAADGSPLPDGGQTALVLPQGWQGPAFMVFDNFNVVMQWNRSVNYALSVAQLAHQLAGGGALVAQSGETGALSIAQLKTLQQALNELGFDAGMADGLLGPRTQTAIRQYQVMHQLPVDGYPAPSVLAHVEQTHAAAAAAGKLVPAPTFADPATDSGE